jgi:hypothetical protein
MGARNRLGQALCLACVAFQACAARTALNEYPRAVIDRPFTLPDGVDSWHLGVSGSYGRDDFSSTGAVGVPLGWTISLSDDWNLNLSPLPLGISHQFLRTDDQWLGASLNLGLGGGSKGLLVAPSLGVAHRIRVARTLAWSTAVYGRGSRWTDQSAWGWSATIAGGPLWQVTEKFSLQPLVGVSVARSTLLLSGLPLDSTSRIIVPLGLGATFSAARQWDVDAALAYDGIGYENGYRAFSATVRVVQFW